MVIFQFHQHHAILRNSDKSSRVSFKFVGYPAQMLPRPRWERNYSKWEWCVWVCGWGGGCSDDCGLDLRLTTWEERLVCFHNMFLMTQVHAALMTYILFASWWQRRTNNQYGTAFNWNQDTCPDSWIQWTHFQCCYKYLRIAIHQW